MSIRKINWLESAVHSLQTRVPEIAHDARYLAEKMSAVFLERLPPSLGAKFIRLLPSDLATDVKLLEINARSESNASIGYPDFILAARMAIGVTDSANGRVPTSENREEEDEFLRRVADAFLWGLMQEVPAELKARLTMRLPLDLRSRMNLYSASSDESRVA